MLCGETARAQQAALSWRCLGDTLEVGFIQQGARLGPGRGFTCTLGGAPVTLSLKGGGIG